MATYDITQASFDINNIVDGDILNCPYTGSETNITLPPGRYTFNVVGASGNIGMYTSTSTTTYRQAGGGGTSTGTIEFQDDTTLYINVGGCGTTYTGSSSTTRTGGYNGGGSANYCGGVGGGATHIATSSGLLSSLINDQQSILIVAGGGGGGLYFSRNGSNYYAWGGVGGGTSGGAGARNGSASTTYCGQGGTQTAGGAAGTSTSRKGTAGSFGQGGNATGATQYRYSCAAGGGGYYGGGGGSNAYGGGGGGSGYVSDQLTNASTTQASGRVTTYTDGSAQIVVEELFVGNKYNVTLSLSGANFIDGHERGTYEVREGRDFGSLQFVPLNKNDPVKVFVNDVDMSSSVLTSTISNSVVVNARTDASYGFQLDTSDNYYKSQNKGVANSAAVCRVNFTVMQQSTLRFTVVSYTEEDYDIGVIGKLDTGLSTSYETDTVGFWNSMGHNSQSEQTVDIPCMPGEHFVDIKYIKDPATNAGNDAFWFKVQILPLSSDTNYIYTYNVGTINGNTTIRILLGDVNTNLSVLSSGENVYLNPMGESSVYKGEDYELQITEIDTETYYIDKVLDNNVDVTSQLVAPHTRPNGTYVVGEQTGASYTFTQSGTQYQSPRLTTGTAALSKVTFTLSVPSRVTILFNSTYSGSGTSCAFGVFSEIDGALRTDSGIDTQGFVWNQYDVTSTVSNQTLTYNIPAGEHYILVKYGNATSNSTMAANSMNFEIQSIEPLEDLYVPYYTYTLDNVQVAHNIIVVTKVYPIYNINVDCNEFGSVDKLGINNIRQGRDITITCTPATNYITDTIYLNSNPTTFSGNTYTLSNIQNDANIYVLFTTGSTQFYQKENGSWRQVVQAYRKVNGEWEEIQFTAVGDPNAKYIRKN